MPDIELTEEEREEVRQMSYAGGFSQEKAARYVKTVERIIAARVEQAEAALRESDEEQYYRLLQRAEKAEAERDRHGPCICNTGPGTEGPDEFCPHHGRTYDDALDYVSKDFDITSIEGGESVGE